MNNWQERFYMGTWQMGGEFGPMSTEKCRKLVTFAWAQGITHFDTAAVYGQGKSESILGDVLPTDAVILTKVPAVKKPSLDEVEDINNFYPLDSVKRSIEGSLERLKRDKIQTVILHNWSRRWSCLGEELEACFIELKQAGTIKRIGISLPDNFGQRIPEAILQKIQVIEAPVNPLNKWLSKDLDFYRKLGIEVIIRSIFLQGAILLTKEQRGLLLETDPRRARYSDTGLPFHTADELLIKAWKMNTSLVVGMMNENEITQNLATISQL